MEHPCYKCGQSVEEGVPFCLHCSAPQIRVVVAEPPYQAAGTVASTAPSAGSASLPSTQTFSDAILPLRWPQTVQPCALAALLATLLIAPFAALLMALGLNPVLAMIGIGFGAGFLAVALYRRRRPGTGVKVQVGVNLVSLSGLLWFGMTTIMEALLVTFLHEGPEFQKELISRIQQAASQTSDPQALAMFDRLKTPEGLVFLMLFVLVFAFFAAIILAGIGGALGGAILGRNDKA